MNPEYFLINERLMSPLQLTFPFLAEVMSPLIRSYDQIWSIKKHLLLNAWCLTKDFVWIIHVFSKLNTDLVPIYFGFVPWWTKVKINDICSNIIPEPNKCEATSSFFFSFIKTCYEFRQEVLSIITVFHPSCCLKIFS